jgi:prepilin-type N-terminal cleavage/methylation domain-containing protein
MLHNLKIRNKQKGFTIIEVMIVLAIAGLIMLVVFLAVPALQRSSRNTQRKNDVSAIASGIANYIDNNGGTLPGNTGVNGTDLNICGANCSSGNTETAKLGFYDPSKVTKHTYSSTLKVPDGDTVYIVLGYACNSTNTALGSPSSRSAAILYATESSSSAIAQQCQEQ